MAVFTERRVTSNPALIPPTGDRRRPAHHLLGSLVRGIMTLWNFQRTDVMSHVSFLGSGVSACSRFSGGLRSGRCGHTGSGLGGFCQIGTVEPACPIVTPHVRVPDL